MRARVPSKDPPRYPVSVEFEGKTYSAEYYYEQARVVVTHHLLGSSSTRTAGDEMDRAILAPGLLRGLLLYGKATKGLLDLCVATKKPAGCG